MWLRDPRAGVSSLVEGLVPDTVEYGVWDIPKLVFTCKGSEPGFSWTPQLGDSGLFFFFSFLSRLYTNEFHLMFFNVYLFIGLPWQCSG